MPHGKTLCVLLALALTSSVSRAADPAAERGTGDGSAAPAARLFSAPAGAPDENPLRPASEGSARTALAGSRTSQSILPATYYYVNVLGTDFHPRTSASTFAYGFNGCVYLTAGTDNRLMAPLHLPDGAALKYVRFYYNDTAATDLTFWLTKYVPGVSSVDIVSASSSGTAGYGSILTTEIGGPNPGDPPAEAVDNYSYGYSLIAAPNANAATATFCGARVAYYMPADGHFTAIAPCRVVDTRGGAPLGGGYLPPAVERIYTMAGNCGIPANATGISLNATATNVAGSGFLSLWKTGTAYPTVSTLNFNLGETQVNAAIVPLNTSGQLSVAFGVNGGHLILDVNGYYY
jgi:hypothetical protein